MTLPQNFLIFCAVMIFLIGFIFGVIVGVTLMRKYYNRIAKPVDRLIPDNYKDEFIEEEIRKNLYQ